MPYGPRLKVGSALVNWRRGRSTSRSPDLAQVTACPSRRHGRQRPGSDNLLGRRRSDRSGRSIAIERKSHPLAGDPLYRPDKALRDGLSARHRRHGECQQNGNRWRPDRFHRDTSAHVVTFVDARPATRIRPNTHAATRLRTFMIGLHIYLPPPRLPASIICSAFSMPNVPDVWLGGYSLNVPRNCPTMAALGINVHSLSPHHRAYIIDWSW